jgi:PAS domain S-box-containing protein
VQIPHDVSASELRLERAGLTGTLVSLIDQAVLLLDEQGRIQEASERFAQLTGWSSERLLGTPFAQVLHEDERLRWKEKFSHARDAGRLRDAFRIQRADGPPFHAECVVARAGNDQWLAVLRDISEQYGREQELQRRNREAVALFEFARQARLSADTTQLLDTIVRNIPWILECHFSAVGIPQAGRETLAWAAVSGGRTPETPVEGMQELLARVRADRAPVIISASDGRRLPAFVGAEGLQSAVAFPLALKDSLLGVLVTGYRAARVFAEEELRFLSSVADTTALVLDNARLYRAAADHAARLKALSSRITAVQEQERTRIARELHDGIGQAMTAIRLNLELLMKESGLGQGRERMDTIGSLIDETLQEIRTMAFELHPTVLDHVGLAAAARIFVERFARQTELPIALRCPDDFPRQEPEVEATLYRILQEALTNVIRHARASSAEVELGSEPGAVYLQVADNGRGFLVERDPMAVPVLEGLGILNMRERLDELGGTLLLNSAPGAGTTVRAAIPIRR